MYDDGSSIQQVHVWAMGLRPKPVRLLNVTLRDSAITTELPVVNLKNLLRPSSCLPHTGEDTQVPSVRLGS